jgi:hypothetical protein
MDYLAGQLINSGKASMQSISYDRVVLVKTRLKMAKLQARCPSHPVITGEATRET